MVFVFIHVSNHTTKVCAETNFLEVVLLWNNIDTQRTTINSFLGDMKKIFKSFDVFF